ncbi:MAG: 2-oxoglutarate oxidoreductase [Desulfobacteraceae bacterium 4572_35.1]|nr:MAG: 2-oxoglutarate oxidoreductase [Desulfobacteraceae bacterium 4572_35.1]
MKKIFSRPDSLKDVQTHYCPGCQHGTIHRLVAEALDYFGIKDQIIGVASVGCSVFLYGYFDVDVIEAPHGRAPAVATGARRVHPERPVFTYQGDGDLAAIGTSEIIHTANRGELMTVIFVNNTTYGMTGGQMAPTSMPGQKTSTTPYGRDVSTDGYPIKMAELLSGLDGTAYSVRVAVDNPKHVIQAGKAIRKAFQTQLDGKGFAFVEVLSTCPTNWKMDPLAANQRVADEMIPYFPLGVYKDATA